jgi:hypothetical protein
MQQESCNLVILLHSNATTHARIDWSRSIGELVGWNFGLQPIRARRALTRAGNKTLRYKQDSTPRADGAPM